MQSNHGPWRSLAEELAAASTENRPTLEEWRTAAEKSLGGRPLRTLTVTGHEGVAISPLYTAADAGPSTGTPGTPPFVRGRGPLGAGRGGWKACPRIDHPDPRVAQEQIVQALGLGAEALWLVVDRPAAPLSGSDEWSNLHRGVQITTSELLGRLLHLGSEPGLPVHLDAGSRTAAVAAQLIAAAAALGLEAGALHGSLGCDPLASLVVEGELPGGLDGALAQMCELYSWTADQAPGLLPVTVSSLSYNGAGATAVQELAFTLATALVYLRSLESAGVPPAVAARSMRVVCAVGRDFFTEIAKLRALRGLWWSMMEACGVHQSLGGVQIHAVTSPRCLAVRDPWVNLLRVTTQGFAAAVAGADCLTTLPFDAAIGPADAQALRLALNTQTILREESHLNRVVDPAGGSYYVEHLGDQLARAAWAELQSIEADGGMAACILGGEIHQRLDAARAARERALATRKDPITGVSSFPNLEEERLHRHLPDSPTISARPEEKSPSGAKIHTMADAVEAAAVGATVDDLAEALVPEAAATRVPALAVHREAATYEQLRDRSDRWWAEHEHRPRVFLVTLGPLAAHHARADFTHNLLAAAGIESVAPGALHTPEESAEAFGRSGTTVAVICSSDHIYGEAAADTAAALKKRGAKTVLLAGRPGDSEAAWRAAGVDRFLYLGCDVLQILGGLLEDLGVNHD